MNGLTGREYTRILPVAVAVAAVMSLSASLARAETFEDLEGKSVVYAYREKFAFPNGNTVDTTWAGTVYVAPDGRVFFRHHGSSHFGHSGSEFQQTTFDTEGDRDGNGNGRRTNYRWDGNGFSRTWTDKGVQVTQVIAIQGGRCRSYVERSSFDGTPTGQSGSCRIVPGNLLRR